MMLKTPSYLLMQSIENQNNYRFESDLEIKLKRIIPNDQIFIIDNFSDAVSRHHASVFIRESANLSIIANIQESSYNSVFSSIINQVIRKDGVQLFSINSSKQLLPAMKLMKGSEFENEKALIDKLSQSI